jgi:hypothetical protein
MSHPCPRPGCQVTTVDDTRLMCGGCWAVVPEPFQRAVSLAYARGRGLGTPALRAAQKAAVAAAARVLAPEPT